MPYELPPMRPPSEARSLLIRVMRGCPWNYCTFCSAYKDVQRKTLMRSVEDVKGDIYELRMHYDEIRRQGPVVAPSTAVLADSNAIIIKTADLIQIVTHLLAAFPSLERVTSYGRAKTVLA
ncbi:MAG: radical SAM protein, partial [Dehalococcoidia bacterium]